MAFDLKYLPDLNGLEIKLNGKTNSSVYSQFLSFFNGLEKKRQIDDFTWVFPVWELDNYMNKFAYHTCMTQTIGSIKGTEKPIIPEFEIDNKYLDEFKLEPFPFQKIGISFLHQIEKGILGDTMGLGKSIQAIGATHKLLKEKKVSKILVVCPASLKYQWHDELLKFTDYESVVIEGTPKKRKKQYDNFSFSDIHFYIVNYETLRNDIDIYKTLDIDCIVCDEAHRLKNQTSKTFKALIQLKPKYRFALTGTPMQNKPEEIFALMKWINPDILGGITKFRKKHVVVGEKFGKRFVELGYKELDDLREKISPYILRRMKEEVAPDLPEIIYSTGYVDMNEPQRKLYEAVNEDFQLLQKGLQDFYETQTDEEAEKGESPKEEQQILGYLYMQQAIADHPLLLAGSNSGMARKYMPLVKKCKSSPKLEEMVEIIKPLIEQGSKIVIFTQYARMLHLIKDRLFNVFQQEPYVIYGDIPLIKRNEQLKRFEAKSDRQMMVLTDAGNYGLNIQFADTLINFETPWNPAVKDQRNGRIHRIGSKHEVVNIINMVTNGTIDETVIKTVYDKKQINNGLIEKNEAELEIMKEMLDKFT